MSGSTVAVYCPSCDGASADHRLPPCCACKCGGKLYVTRLPDGSLPPWDGEYTGRPVREWYPVLLGTPPVVESPPLRGIPCQ